ncbi:Family 43 glycosylhydrolase OS=Streptomyces tendae OX=1932 GN=GUR47_23105 PE=3 SV=1 [Streptomyces tendae]
MLPSPATRPRSRPGARLGPLLAALLALVVGLLPGLTGPATAAPAPSAPPAEAAAAAGTFRNPLNSGPDPFMTHWKGAYYLTTTQGGSIRMWRSPSLGTLATADPVTVWTDTDPSRNRNIWAPPRPDPRR